MYVASGLATAVVRAAGLYETRQHWLDRERISGGLRELYETCWAAADADLERFLHERIEQQQKEAEAKAKR